ncbi:MAG: glycerophosphodiester phosphodiesterase [Myxococcales bacterium]|nr:glycerophosphodiester phosphodiesterase [Myxococcales bacterium]MCB9734395.1 glycerophosphodiester phosphodiesterase [Deltaproteobacteria bacterium]
MTTRAPALIAHRGASADAPENTLAAFRRALDDGADGVEMDVRLTRDGVPVVFHDDDLARLTGAAGPIEQLDAAAVAALRVPAGGGEGVPTLADVLGAIAPALADPARAFLVNVELKPAGSAAAALVAACRPLLDPLAEHLVVSSFDPRVILAAAAGADWPLAYLYETPLALAALPHFPAGLALDLHPRHDLVTAEHLAGIAAPGRRVRTWTIDDPVEARRVAALGVAAVITNRPARLRAELAGDPPPEAA